MADGDDGEMFVDVFDSITQKQNDELMSVSFFLTFIFSKT